MKTFLLFTLLSFSMSGLCQLPVNSGIVYYKFQEKIVSDTCAHFHLMHDAMIGDNINKLIFDYNYKKISDKRKRNHQIGIFVFGMSPIAKSCAASSRRTDDPLEIFINSELVPIKFVDVLGNHKKTKFKAGSIRTYPTLEFDENNNYTLKFKGFTLHFYVYEGKKMTPKTMQLGEFYEKYQNNSEKSAVIEEMFQEIDDNIKFLNNTFKEQLQKTIKIAELD